MGRTIFMQFFHDTSLIIFNSSSKFQRRVKKKKERRRWWLFHAKDFQSLMYPCFVFCRILGIFPYKIKTSSLQTSKPCYILSIIVMCVFCFCTLLIIYLVNISGWFYDQRGWFDGQNVRKIIEINFFYIFGSFIMVVTFVSNGSRIRLLQTILEISSRLPSESYQKQSMLIHAKDIFGFFFLLLHSLICFYGVQIPILMKTFSLYIVLLIFQMDMLYVNCVCVLKTCFKKINDDVANLLIMHDELYLVRQTYHEQRNPLLLMELKNLKKRHLIVSDTVQMLNIIFGPQLLATITLYFIIMTFELYFNMVQWENGWFISPLKADRYNLTYIMHHSIKTALMIWVCEASKNQAMKIKTIVHDVLNSTSDKQIKHELQLFSLQIMHYDNTFSAKGFILDARLITAMISTITTYLLILIQFLIASHFCDEKTAINVTQAT